MKSAETTSSHRRRTTVFVDLYLLEPSLGDADPCLKLLSRFRGRKAAQRALANPEFVFDLTRNGGCIYMSTVEGGLPPVATRLPSDDTAPDDDQRCWFRGYPRMNDGSAMILWSLVWPRPDVVDELLDLIIRV